MIDLTIQGLAQMPAGASAGQEAFKPDLTLLDRTLRRGLSDVTRYFFHVAHGALLDAGVSAGHVRLVFASAYGEIGTAEAMLAQAYDENGASPARFRNSVHNTAPGLLSISARNTYASTALSAGDDTVAMALLESQLLLREDPRPVLLVCAEESVPASLRNETALDALAVAWLLGRAGTPGKATLTRLARQAGTPGERAITHPLAGALALTQAVVDGRSEPVVLGGGPQPYTVQVTCLPAEGRDARES